MKKALALSTLIVSVLALMAVLNMGFASFISIGTYDAVTGEAKTVFAVGEPVRIKASSDGKPINITVKDPDGITVYFESYDDLNYDKTLNGITVKSGWYTVEVSSPINSQQYNFACISFNVIPEAPLGTIGTATIIVLAFTSFGLIKQRRSKI